MGLHSAPPRGACSHFLLSVPTQPPWDPAKRPRGQLCPGHSPASWARSHFSLLFPLSHNRGQHALPRTPTQERSFLGGPFQARTICLPSPSNQQAPYSPCLGLPSRSQSLAFIQLCLPLDSPTSITSKLSPSKLLPCHRLSHTHLRFPGNVIPTTLLPPGWSWRELAILLPRMASVRLLFILRKDL